MPGLRTLCLAGAILAGPLAVAAAAPDAMTVCTDNQDASVALPACLAAAQDKNRPVHDRAVAYATAGITAANVQDMDAARGYFGQALTLDPNSDAAYAGQATAEFMAGGYDAATADATKAVALKPNGHPEAYLLLGTLADRDGDHEARIRYISKAIALAPEFAEAYAGRASGYYSAHEYNLALADLGKAVALKPGLADTLEMRFELNYIGRGDQSMKAGNYAAAIDDYGRAIKLNPRSVPALSDRGDAYNAAGEYGNAVVDLSRAIGADPSNAAALGNRGVSYFALGKDNLALADLDRAIASGEQPASIYFVRGLIQQRRSDRRSALADFRKALEAAPADDPDRAHIQSAITSAGG